MFRELLHVMLVLFPLAIMNLLHCKSTPETCRKIVCQGPFRRDYFRKCTCAAFEPYVALAGLPAHETVQILFKVSQKKSQVLLQTTGYFLFKQKSTARLCLVRNSLNTSESFQHHHLVVIDAPLGWIQHKKTLLAHIEVSSNFKGERAVLGRGLKKQKEAS